MIEDIECDPTCLNDTRKIPLHLASAGGHFDTVKYLVVNCNCDPQCIDKNQQTPLHFAAANGHLDIVKYLTITHLCGHHRSASADTPLHYAARYGHVEVARYLIHDLKCDPNVMNKYGIVPLHYASILKLLSILLRYRTVTPNFKIGT